MAVAPAAAAASATLIEPNTLVLMPLVPILLQHRYVLECSGVKNDVGFELRDEAHDPIPVANVGNTTGDRRVALLALQRFENGMQCGFRMLDHQQPGRPKCHNAITDFRTD